MIQPGTEAGWVISTATLADEVLATQKDVQGIPSGREWLGGFL